MQFLNIWLKKFVVGIMIIGITGKYASGKGEIAGYLKKKGFEYFSFSAMIEEECKNRWLPVKRENTIKVANELRQKHGNSYLAKRIISSMDKEKNYVVESFRNPDEVNEFKKLPDFRLLLVDAPVEVRYDRSVDRKRHMDSDFTSFEKFKELEEFESKNPNKSAQQLDECAKMADIKIANNSTLAALQKKVDSAVKKISLGAME